MRSPDGSETTDLPVGTSCQPRRWVHPQTCPVLANGLEVEYRAWTISNNLDSDLLSAPQRRQAFSTGALLAKAALSKSDKIICRPHTALPDEPYGGCHAWQAPDGSASHISPAP